MQADESRQQYAFTLLHWLVAILVGIPGWYRILHGDMASFAVTLSDSANIGMALAITITLLQALGAIALAFRRMVLPLCLIFAAYYVLVIMFHHLPFGWFTSGAKVDGMEFSVMRSILFLCLAWQHVPTKKDSVVNTCLS